jgi:hypothetical protein
MAEDLPKPRLTLTHSTPCLIGQSVSLTWLIVPNATMYVYAKQGNLSSEELDSLSPIATLPMTQNSYNHQPNAVGVWSYALRAVNSSKPNSTSEISTVIVETIAVSPPALHILSEETIIHDGVVALDWPDVPLCQYNVFGRKNTPISETNDIITMLPLNALLLSNSEFTVTGLSSGLWYFAILSVNSSGKATSLSPSISVQIQFIPLQSQLYLEQNTTTDGIMAITWDSQNEALRYRLYRVFSPELSIQNCPNLDNTTQIYAGTSLSFNEFVSEVGYYFYYIIAENQYGSREIDCIKGVWARRLPSLIENNSTSTNSTSESLPFTTSNTDPYSNPFGGSIGSSPVIWVLIGIGVSMIGYCVKLKRNIGL